MKKINVRTMVIYAVYLAIMLAMNFIPQVGYITAFPGKTVTLMLVPVSIMSIHLGWKGTLVAWTWFGLMSVAATPVFEPTTPEFLGWGATVLGYLGGRVSAGIVIALILFLLKDRVSLWVTALIVGLLSPFLNALFVLGYLFPFIHSKELFWIFFGSHWINFTIEFSTTVPIALASVSMLKFQQQKDKQYHENRH